MTRLAPQSIWPFNDKDQAARMAAGSGWTTDDDWTTDPGWSTRMSKAARMRIHSVHALAWPTDPIDETDRRWIAGRSSASRGSTSAAPRPVVSLGYHPDLPDRRDRAYPRLNKPEHAALGKRFPVLAGKAGAPERINNIPWCSPIEDQQTLGSCTAQAVVGLAEYMQIRGNASYTEGSRLFLYKVSRRLLGWTGDTGAYIRSAMKAIATFGIPPEQYWPYDIERFDEEPSAFLYSFAANYQALNYTRLDPSGSAGKDVLATLRAVLASGLCAAFGFPVYSSIDSSGEIAWPTDADRLLGGHAVLAVGYDDNHYGEGKGAVLIRNSWGTRWGYGGYGFLPYEYVTERLARDFWLILKAEWLDLAPFE